VTDEEGMLSVMTTIQQLVDNTIRNIETKIDVFTFHETCTVILSTLIEEDYGCWLKIKEIMERVEKRCEVQTCYNMPPATLGKLIEFTYLMKLALHLGKQIEVDHAKTSTSPQGRLM
jgi:hypothetical protein